MAFAPPGYAADPIVDEKIGMPGTDSEFTNLDGGPGGNADAVDIENDSEIDSAGTAIRAASIGGDGGDGAFISGTGTKGGHGGNAGNVTVHNLGNLSTSGGSANGIDAEARAGNGGDGYPGLFDDDPNQGHDGRGGRGSDVEVVNNGLITAGEANSRGIYARSLGGAGGAGGFYALILEGPTGLAGNVTIDNTGEILTHGDVSGGIVAQSIGGFSTEGSSVRTGGTDANGGHGGRITIHNAATLLTTGDDSLGISAQSIGGGGGHGADAGGSHAVGGAGSEGGDGGEIHTTLLDQTDVQTSGARSAGLMLQSIGGGGGSGGNANASGSSAVAIGGSGGQAGHGDLVMLSVEEQASIETLGQRAVGIVAQSIGGGGGVGGHAHASGHGLLHSSALAIGGNGGGGGHGGHVDIEIDGQISTLGLHSTGVLAQSIGGGGGAGGTSVAHASALLSSSSHSIGGSGGAAGAGGEVTVTGSDTGTIATQGEGADGILAQSIGGGGGNGGAALAVAESIAFSKSLAVGGAGGAGSHGGQLEVDTGSTISTLGDHSAGIRAQSIGGGGGNGGASISMAGSVGGSLSQSVGGVGGAANNGGSVNVATSSAGHVSTTGHHAPAIQAQSIGGGGGNGGSSTAGAIGGIVGVASSVGGTAGGGGESGVVTVNVAKPADSSAPLSHSVIVTTGEHADAIQAQSIGGGGGNGGASVAGAASLGLSASYSVGGQGGDGGHGNDVTIYGASHITTSGSNSYGVRAQSIGGGGGNGGYSAAGAATIDTLGGAFSVGGAAGDASHAGNTTVTTEGQIVTHGANSGGVLAQSIGGGGGTGGVAGALSLSLSGGAGSMSIGGSGGMGGNAGTVELMNNADVSTSGDNAVAVMGHSIGGGGGSGGMSISASGGLLGAASVSVGGQGAHGGDGSTVLLDSSGNVSTAGKHAHGVQAQSVGGGGGNGGVALSGAAVVTGGSVAASIGGAGDGGGHGAAVLLINSGNVTTQGDSSHSITAQSIGGGGGHGGFAASLSASADALATASVSVGGSGAQGGDASNVTVDSLGGEISTHGIGSNGIHAQSIGGGGGDGGFAASATLSVGDTPAKGELTLGGSGGAGGAGGVVNLSNASAIGTGGDFTAGILAQSIGGGGGSGGFAANLSASAGGPSANISAALGGNGAAGNGAARVDVTNSNNITATGRLNAAGIKAQSIGGGGGNGGFSFTGNVDTAATKNLAVSLGGSGGAGGMGGQVQVVHSSGTVSTAGLLSDGILAQSVGGGGGHGGAAVSVQLGTHATGNTINAAVDVGGQGGSGQVGNTVTVVNNAHIHTAGVESRGVFAQSIGGSGGSGGKAFTLIAEVDQTAPGDNTARTTNIGFTVGGDGGDGNIGGEVNATSTGTITTEAASSHGIYAQSVGGGGGEGGSAHSKSFILGSTPEGPPPAAGEELPTTSSKDVNASFTAIIGGNGGTGGHGGDVSATNTGLVEARGAGSVGIFAQSIGGGGGNGGNGALGTGEYLFDDAAKAGSLKYSRLAYARDLTVAVGGSGALSGDGGAVTAVNSGQISTQEEAGHGIFAQSVGGGGGVGGAASVGLTGKIGIGGAAGAGGNASPTTVDHQAGSIETHGHAASGIFAQSIGGGGGTAGNINRALSHEHPVAGETIPTINMGVNVGYARGGGNGGDGDTVNVASAGDITTHGEASYGIFAQSVGGGGGVAGTLGNELLQHSHFQEVGETKESWTAAGHVGSVGDAGSAGAVEITQDGRIETHGERAHAVFAQSAGGQGTGDAVTLQLDGDVYANHSGTYGVLAQSVGLGGNGDITVNVDGGVVSGGAEGGGGIRFEDGRTNHLDNRGLVTTTAGVHGNAVVGTDGDEHIDNYGTLVGSVHLGAGTNSLTTHAGGVYYSGATVDLHAASASFQNDGLLAPGGSGDDATLLTTHVTGSFHQSAAGTLEVDFDLGEDALSDHLAVDGDAVVEGALRLNPINANRTVTGDRKHVLVTTGGTATAANLNLEAPDSVIVRYALAPASANEIAVVSTTNFAPEGLQENERQIGQALNRIRAAGEADALDQVVAELVLIPNEAGLATAYQQIAGDVHSANQSVEQMSTSSMNQVLSQRLNSIAGAAPRGVSSGFAIATDTTAQTNNDIQMVSWQRELTGRSPRREKDYASRDDWYGWTTGYGAGGSLGDIEYRFAGALTGMHRWVDDSALAGVFVAMGHNATEDKLAPQSSTSTVTQIGTYFRHEALRSEEYFLFTTSWGYSDIESERHIRVGSIREIAQGDSRGGQASISLQLGTAYELAHIRIAPWSTLQYTYVYQHGFQEFGAGSLNLLMDDSDSNSLRSTLGASFIGTDRRWQPTFRIGWLHEYLADNYLVRSQFASINNPIAFSNTAPELPRDMLLLGAGVTPIERDCYLLRINYDGQFNGDQVLHTGSLTAEYVW